MESLSNKWAIEEIEEMSVGIFTTVAYGITSKKVCNGEKPGISTNQSTWGPQSSLVLK